MRDRGAAGGDVRKRRLESLSVSVLAGTGEVFFQGAQVVEWSLIGAEPVLWVGSHNRFHESDPIRGGIPICLPWFGNRAAPRHGFARIVPWELSHLDRDSDHLALTFDLDHQPRGTDTMGWPHPFQARFRVDFSETLMMTLQVRHLGNRPAQYEPALHPYLRVGDLTRVRISGLEGKSFTDHATTPHAGTQLVFDEGGIDRVYTCSTSVTIHDDSNKRDITLDAPNAASRVIWNPGSKGSSSSRDLANEDWRSFLCVEPGNVHENAITLAAGDQHTFTSVIRVTSQS